MDLTDSQRNALENLERKRQGNEVPYVNIASARILTDLGFAERKAQGWQITQAGREALQPKHPKSTQ